MGFICLPDRDLVHFNLDIGPSILELTIRGLFFVVYNGLALIFLKVWKSVSDPSMKQWTFLTSSFFWAPVLLNIREVLSPVPLTFIVPDLCSRIDGVNPPVFFLNHYLPGLLFTRDPDEKFWFFACIRMGYNEVFIGNGYNGGPINIHSLWSYFRLTDVLLFPVGRCQGRHGTSPLFIKSFWHIANDYPLVNLNDIPLIYLVFNTNLVFCSTLNRFNF